MFSPRLDRHVRWFEQSKIFKIPSRNRHQQDKRYAPHQGNAKYKRGLTVDEYKASAMEKMIDEFVGNSKNRACISSCQHPSSRCLFSHSSCLLRVPSSLKTLLITDTMLIRIHNKALQRPVLSPDGRHLAVIAPDLRIHIVNIHEAAQGRRFVNGLKVPKDMCQFLQRCSILRWSPETMIDEADDVLSTTTSECDFGSTWLSLSDGKKVIAMSTEVKTPRMMPRPAIDKDSGVKSNILADYDLSGHYGKANLVEFVFNHRYALVMQQYGLASIISLTRPHRDEIQHTKFPDSRGFAAAPDSRYFALLRLDRMQDKVTVFELDQDHKITFKSFDCHTSDAQSLMWCPTGTPMLAVADASTYGVKVSFFTAQGHQLKQLDITPSAFYWGSELANQAQGIGLMHWTWKKAGLQDDQLTLQTFANGQKQVLVRYQSTSSMMPRVLMRITHPETIDGSRTLVWSESTGDASSSTLFRRQTGTIDVKSIFNTDTQRQSPSASSNHVDLIEFNCKHNLLATRHPSSLRTLFLWYPQQPAYPHTVLSFTHSVKQVLFHPFLPHVLLILTTSKSPRIYVWYQENLPPISGLVPIDTSSSTNFSTSWLGECATKPDGGDGTRCPLLFTSTSAFEAGYLSSVDGRVVFKSILSRGHHLANGDTSILSQDDDDSAMTTEIDTPSRPGKTRPADDMTASMKKARFEVPPNRRTDRDDPVHEEAGVRLGYAW